jgi:hypothetical protein
VIITTEITAMTATAIIILMIATRTTAMTANELNNLDFSEFSPESPYGFGGFVPIKELMGKRCEQVSREPGIYIVSIPKGFVPKFLPNSPVSAYKGKNPSESVQKLKENWVTGTTVIYIGMTTESLQKRLKRYMQFGTGRPTSHYGGRLIWQLENIHSCPLAWMVLAGKNQIEEAEKSLIERFKKQYGRFPFANLTNRRS